MNCARKLPKSFCIQRPRVFPLYRVKILPNFISHKCTDYADSNIIFAKKQR